MHWWEPLSIKFEINRIYIHIDPQFAIVFYTKFQKDPEPKRMNTEA